MTDRACPEQQTLAGETAVEGVGLHTGAAVRVRFLPAPAGTGIRFRRTDLAGAPEIPATLSHVYSTDRGTSLAAGEARVHTVEHLLAAVSGLELDNLVAEMAGPEPPVLDGSFRPYLDALAGAGVTPQGQPARVFAPKTPLTVGVAGGASYVAAPADSLKISATIEFEHPLVRRQFGAFTIDPAGFREGIAAARTFGFLAEAEALWARGLARGATPNNTIVLDETGVHGGEPLRWPDEFVRHKIGDLVGDLVLTGGRVHAHVVAERPSHAGNVALAEQIVRAAGAEPARPIVDISQIMQYLPHRYPMLLVDRIVEFEAGKRIVGIKNVTINEPFFQGHYPGHPIMPGVLIIEAMAQVGGLLLMEALDDPEGKVVYFMSLDNVKWRRPVTPGDQIRFELEMLQLRRQVCRMRGVGYVDGQVVAEADMLAGIRDR
jgi:UDP-3-O-[3-hydroxymyristoyl] N-acetylglucosamine deacetylase/3-hydroxyacyl-[acyl-carrier-protein] dehydratase